MTKCSRAHLGAHARFCRGERWQRGEIAAGKSGNIENINFVAMKEEQNRILIPARGLPANRRFAAIPFVKEEVLW